MGVLNKFAQASGFQASQMKALVTIGALFFITMWACWACIGQFQLWVNGDISGGQWFFGLLRVFAVLASVTYVFSMIST